MTDVTADGLTDAAAHAVRALSAVGEAEWHASAGELAWTRRRTLDHIPDALVIYATHLARRSTVRLPYVRNGDERATPPELQEALTSAAAILANLARGAPPTVRAFHPAGMADPSGFLAMGCDEILVHTHDIVSGTDVAFDPPPELCRRVVGRLFPWAPTEAEPWEALLWANGRQALPGYDRLAPDWYWHCAPLSEWDGTVKKRQPPPAW